MITKPMLAAPICEESVSESEVAAVLAGLRYPLLGTPKIDGIRTLKDGGRAFSRSLKPVGNAHTRAMLEGLPDGLDGEFWIPDTSFSDISGAWRRESGKPNFQYLVFDYMNGNPHLTYEGRMNNLRKLALPPWCQKLLPILLESPEEVLAFEEACLAQNWEGIMLRDPKGPYKFGRSTVREGWLLKFKRFADAEAVVVGFQEQVSNQNPATTNELGHTARSSHRAGLVKKGVLGAFIVEGLSAFPGVRFNVGTGFDDAQRARYWLQREHLQGQIIKFRYQPVGVKDSPRFPRFVGFRAAEDMSAD